MKAELIRKLRETQRENKKADLVFVKVQIALLVKAGRTLVQRASHFGVHLSISVGRPQTLQEAQTAFLVLRGRFLNALDQSDLSLKGPALHELALSNTLLFRTFDLGYHSWADCTSIALEDHMTPKEFQDQAGKRIAKLREKNKFSQDKLAKAIGTSSATIARMEAGKQRIGITKVFRIAKVLGITPNEILSDDKVKVVRPAMTLESIERFRKQLDQEEAKLKAASGS